jgi:hypothetical protein
MLVAIARVALVLPRRLRPATLLWFTIARGESRPLKFVFAFLRRSRTTATDTGALYDEKLLFALALAFAVIGGAAAGPADGTWEVKLPGGRGGGRGCSGELVVRLTIVQGRLSGVFLGGRGTQTIENLVLKPDGSFTGITSGGDAPGGLAKVIWSVSGQFSGNTPAVTLTKTTEVSCAPRTGQGTRTGG